MSPLLACGLTDSFITLLSCSVFRYEVNFQLGIDCGGAYVKLLTQTPDLDLVSLTHHTQTHLKHQNMF